jgi:nucleoside-diphosphate-sugar epimerase
VKYLITGGCGFLGTNLTINALEENHKVIVFDNFGSIYKYSKTLSKIGRFNNNISKLQQVKQVVYDRYRKEINLINSLDYDQIKYYFDNGYPKFQFHI